MLNTETIQSLIDSGEGYNVEFKVRVPSKVRELTEEICAFANADGGYLLIGVDIEPMAGYMVEKDFVTLLKEAAHFFGCVKFL